MLLLVAVIDIYLPILVFVIYFLGNKMNNKFLVSVIYVSLLSIVIGLIGLMLDTSRLDIFLEVGEVFFVVVGVYLLVSNGEFVKTREYKISKVGISLFILGILFKILHLQRANEIIGLGFIVFITLYLVYMIRNRQLEWTNYFKFLFLLTVLTGKFLLLIHENYSDELIIASEFILIILVFNFIRTNKLYISKN